MKNIKKLGLIAGNGNLPLQIVDECNKNNIEVVVIILKNFANRNVHFMGESSIVQKSTIFLI